ncbi:putative lipase, partial [Lachnellula subtilissima]
MRRNSTSEDDSTHVYRNPESKSKQSRIQVAEKQVHSDEESGESEREERQTQAESVKERPRKRKIKIVYITEEDYQSTKPKERKVREKKLRDDDHQEREGSIRRSKTHRSHQKVSAEAIPASPPKRSTSTREPASTSPHSIRRSHTTSSHIPSVKQYAPSLTTTNTANKRSSFLGGFFTPAPQPHREPERLTMVELKEGCNHMTCHCTAEFCMICGLKWKSCNCPWFNYDAVEADRLQHMQVPEPVRNEEVPPPHRLQRPRRPRPNTYLEEINDRRRQERLDEEMARRLQTVSIGDDNDYQGGIGDIHGIGNGADHFMNQDYIRAAHNILTGTFDQATAAANYVMGVAQARGAPPPPQPGPRRMSGRYPVPVRAPSPPLLRTNSAREEAYNSASSTRPSERIVPRRTRTGYESEAAVHAPVGNIPQSSEIGSTNNYPQALAKVLDNNDEEFEGTSAKSQHILTPRRGIFARRAIQISPNMLLLYQTGSVKIGEVVRYTVTYTPAHDRILPSPASLHLKIKNSSAIALRAAFIHGPYTLYAAAYPASFHPDSKFETSRTHGVPEFEPYLKAGGTFTTQLLVPEDVREGAGSADRDGASVSWIIEVSSQVIFSTSAAVHYEILLARDEKSLGLGFASSLTGGSNAIPTPGQVSDHQQSQGAKDGHHSAQPKGVFSKAITVRVDDTASLWNTPRLPQWDDAGKERGKKKTQDAPVESVMDDKADNKKEHSNLGSDMLYMKESIDASAKQAKIDARKRRAERRKEEEAKAAKAGENADEHHDVERKNDEGEMKHPSDQHEENLDEDEDEEEIIVRGFSGNATRTERGIKYLGKRLAKYVLAVTYPDQPYRSIAKKASSKALSRALTINHQSAGDDEGPSTHKHSTIHKEPLDDKTRAYKITSISFIAHSLGGLTQTYAVGYIQKHSPQFFDIIKPINFISLASPFLGLSNENPLYVKFALDFGLVGRTGQDLGLTWRAPTIARSGWGAIVGGIGDNAQKKIDGQTSPESKPLLRILPTGPAHTVLKKFRNRTVYSNVVNDGIVPLRTSCLLFLDWQGLGRVEKAVRENGLVGTMANWGWAEITGQNTVSPIGRSFSGSGNASDSETPGLNTPTRQGHGAEVPQPGLDAIDDDNRSLRSLTNTNEPPNSTDDSDSGGLDVTSHSQTIGNGGALASIVKFFQPSSSNSSPKSHNHSPKQTKIYKRSQTLRVDSDSSVPSIQKQPSSPQARGKATTGDSGPENPEGLSAPPKTTFFESAGDLLKAPLPTVEFLINPESRSRTIFHDRVYHPSDIPPPPLKKRPSGGSLMTRRRSTSQISSSDSPNPSVPHTDSILSTRDYDDTQHTNPDKDPLDVVDGSAMKVEEKIARAYHRDLSWRKVLVRLEPDAHNNMIVRRMFANAYGWPVIKHLCDTHFSDSAEANTPDSDESNEERAKDENEAPDKDGRETNKKNEPNRMLSSEDRTDSEAREASDEVSALNLKAKPNSMAKALSANKKERPTYERTGTDSEAWSERDWADSGEDSEDEEDQKKKSDEGE